MISDQSQREQALDPSQSFIVQAPAGSGKTELLTQRFLRLLACVQEPEEILAITFTKKAAAEMRARLTAALQKAHYQPKPEIAHEQKTWQLAKQALAQDQARQWGLLANPNRLRIKTIDAFNSLLTQQLPLLSHFGAPPEIIDHPQLLYREAVQTFLAHLEENVQWSKAIARLLTHLDNNMKQAEELLVEMLGKRDQWLPYIMAHQSQPELRQTLENNLAAVIEASLSELQECFQEDCLDELIDLAKFACVNLKAAQSNSAILACEKLEELPGTASEDQATWLGLTELLLTADDTWRKRIDIKLGFPPSAKEQKERLLGLIEHLSADDRLSALLREFRYLPNAHYTDKQWEILQALHEVLKIVVAQLTVIFKLQGTIDYTENAQAALLALGTEEAPTDLALVLDYQIKHLLVDEFQDTSNNQFRLLEKLVHGWQPGDQRSLFLVGDPMQSIYRFREAEVGLFLRARHQGIGPVALTPLTLSVNFRSTAAIVDWLNTHFDKVMPAFDDLSSGAVSYTPSTPQNQGQENAQAVQLHTLVDSFDQAAAILQIVQQSLAEKPEDKIAILVRSRSHLETIIPLFKKANVDYQAVEIDPLESRPLIQDLLALTRAILYPADRVAWLAILRAPWCGMTLNDLLVFASTEAQEPLWQRLQQASTLSLLSADGQARLNRIMPVLHLMISERQRQELPWWVEHIWTLLGGPACVENTLELKDAKIFFALLKKLALAGTGLNGGLQWKALQESISKLYAQSNTSSRIQIMTIHNAKGLEFDMVILPHLEKGTRASDKPLLTWLERPLMNSDSALLLAPIHAIDEEADNTYQHIRKQDNIKTQHENGRLLYVAATRAKKRLHLLASLKTSSKGELASPVDNSMLKNLWPSIQQELGITATTPPLLSGNQTKTRYIRRLVGRWQNPLSAQAAERPPHNKIQGFRLSESKAQALGVVVHRILQDLVRFGFSWWQDKPAEKQMKFIRLLLLQEGVLPIYISESSEKVSEAIENTLKDPRGRWILQQPQGQTEFALTALLDQEPQMLILDRSFVDENNIAWIIDYKTSTPQDHDLADFLAQEKEKYAEKMLSYAQALNGIDSSKPIRLGLYFPLIPAWCEWPVE